MSIISEVTGMHYPTCTDRCEECGSWLGSCFGINECDYKEGRCLDNVSESNDGKFYHDRCFPADLVPDSRGIRDYH